MKCSKCQKETPSLVKTKCRACYQQAQAISKKEKQQNHKKTVPRHWILGSAS